MKLLRPWKQNSNAKSSQISMRDGWRGIAVLRMTPSSNT
jgi:hypothetical protein